MQRLELDSQALYQAFVSGGVEIIRNREEINRINVFPVADGDTGTNLAMTMSSIMENSAPQTSAGRTMQAIADAALTGARGNSGIIFAQFFAGMAESLGNAERVDGPSFAVAARNAERRSREALVRPVEGTILTVMADWVQLLEEQLHHREFGLMFQKTLRGAKLSLENTPNLLPVLKKERVVDAGAEGFFRFLSGMTKFLVGEQGALEEKNPIPPESIEASVHGGEYPVFRYCTEVLLRGESIDPTALRVELASLGDSAIVAGTDRKVRIHVHTDAPAQVIERLRSYGLVLEQKVDDMLREYEVCHTRKYPIALVTDSVCDLPAALLELYQIHVVPMNILAGDEQYLDRLTITNEQVYARMEAPGPYPTTSQPAPAAFRKLFSFLSTYYDSIVAIHVSGRLSGTCGVAKGEAEKLTGKRISVIDSRHDSGSQALIVLRAAELIAAGKTHDEVVSEVEACIPKARIYVSVPTLKYMVKGGRVSPLKGLAAALLNLKPIVSLDGEGAALLYGKAFSTESNLRKILNLVSDFLGNDTLHAWALVHAGCLEKAKAFAERVEAVAGTKPLFIQEISPIIALNAGRNTVAVVLLKE